MLDKYTFPKFCQIKRKVSNEKEGLSRCSCEKLNLTELFTPKMFDFIIWPLFPLTNPAPYSVWTTLTYRVKTWSWSHESQMSKSQTQLTALPGMQQQRQITSIQDAIVLAISVLKNLSADGCWGVKFPKNQLNGVTTR